MLCIIHNIQDYRQELHASLNLVNSNFITRFEIKVFSTAEKHCVITVLKTHITSLISRHYLINRNIEISEYKTR